MGSRLALQRLTLGSRHEHEGGAYAPRRLGQSIALRAVCAAVASGRGWGVACSGCLMDMRVAAYAVVERRGKLLLTHWRRGHLHGWTLPGGGIDPGEDPRDAVVREVLEETGLEAKIGKLIGVDSRVMVREEVPEGTDPELHTIRIVYRASVKEGPLTNEVDGSSDEARWVPIREVRSLRTLSLVQTGMRMAGIDAKGRGRGGQRRPTAKN